jgi:hypothetical protein
MPSTSVYKDCLALQAQGSFLFGTFKIVLVALNSILQARLFTPHCSHLVRIFEHSQVFLINSGQLDFRHAHLLRPHHLRGLRLRRAHPGDIVIKPFFFVILEKAKLAIQCLSLEAWSNICKA